MLSNYKSWKYFILNYDNKTIPYTGSHTFQVLNHMNNFVFNKEEWKQKYPSIANDLKECKSISDKYNSDDNYIITKQDNEILNKTTQELYECAPPLFKHVLQLNESWINKKNELGFKHDEYKGDKTLLDTCFEKIFK